MPKFSSNLVNYALKKRFLSVDGKYVVVKPEIYPNFFRACLFLVKNLCNIYSINHLDISFCLHSAFFEKRKHDNFLKKAYSLVFLEDSKVILVAP